MACINYKQCKLCGAQTAHDNKGSCISCRVKKLMKG